MNKSLNREEIVIGAVYGLIFAFKVGWWAIPLSIACGLLWALGGASGSHKAYRRVGCALLPAILVFFKTGHFLALLSFPLAWAVLCIGYGMPDIDDFHPGLPAIRINDPGSWLGRFWLRHTKNMWWANFLTRTTIYVLLLLSFIPVWIS